VVTGASRGIGLATAVRLRAEEAGVLMVARSPERLREAAARCEAQAHGSGSVEWLAADVTEPATAERVVARARERLGGLDVLVNNAGTSAVRSLDELTDQEWQAQWELHVMAPLRLMRAAAPIMVGGGFGRIVNVCSSAGKRPSQTNAAYSVTKAAQLSLSRVFADAYASRGILVNAVAPGAVASDLWVGEGGWPIRWLACAGAAVRRPSPLSATGFPSGASPSPTRSPPSSCSCALRRRAR